VSDHAIKATRRELRKLVGARAATTVIDTAYDFQMFRRRGFWKRLAWLLFGR
jgi:hypothetical protein